MRSRITTTFVLIALAVAGCISTPTSREHRRVLSGEVSRFDSVIVKVTNRADLAIVVSLWHEGKEVRLGDVSAKEEARFTVPQAGIAGHHVELVATTRRASVRTAPFKIDRGQVAWFSIVPELAGSQAFALWPDR